jgi:hypothetical protein
MPALDWSQCPAVESIPGKRSGAWVFRDPKLRIFTARPFPSGAFVRLESQPTAQDMEQTYLRLRDLLPKSQTQTGTDSPFEARIFRDLMVAARALTQR